MTDQPPDPGNVWEEPPAQPGGQAPPPAPIGTNGFAIASLVTSIMGFFYGFPAILGIAFGFAARSQIKRSGQGGSALALAGIIIGFVWLALFLTLIGVLVVATTNGGS